MEPDGSYSNCNGQQKCESTGEADDSATSVPIKSTDVDFSSESQYKIECLHSEVEAEENSEVLSCKELKEDENALLKLVDSLSADIDSFTEAVDELESMSENVQCLVRNIIIGDGRPAGAWKDLC